MVDFTHTSHHILDVSTGTPKKNPLQGVPQQSKGVNCGSLAAPSMWPAVCQDERWGLSMSPWLGRMGMASTPTYLAALHGVVRLNTKLSFHKLINK